MTPIKYKGKIISIQINYNGYILYFRDSYLLLPSSLRILGYLFNIINHKGYLPHLKLKLII